MNKPNLSAHFESRTPSDVRLAQMKYDERKVKPQAVINVGIGNVSLPTNPAMQKRMFNLDAPESVSIGAPAPVDRPQLQAPAPAGPPCSIPQTPAPDTSAHRQPAVCVPHSP